LSSAAPIVTRLSLDTGLRIVVVEHHARPVATVNLILAHGALSDPPDNAGLTYMAVTLASDFYESMGVNDIQADEQSFRRRVADLGGAATFEVESDFSAVQIAGYASDTAAYLKMIAGAVRNPRHGAGSFRARRDAALDAFESIESEDPRALQRWIAQSAFGPDHPYARSLFGTAESLNTVELQEVMEHQNVIFVPTGATLLVVGDVRPAAVLAAAKTSFGNWQGYKDASPMPSVSPPSLPRGAGEVAYFERRSASTLFTCLTRPLPEVAGADPALRVLTGILGKGMGSRLGRALREENGLTYGAWAEIVRRRQASALIACSALQGEKGEQGLRLFRGALTSLHDAPPTDDEVRRAKALQIAELESAWDDTGSITRTWLEALTLGSGVPHPEQERAALEKVTASDVQKLARTLLRPKTVRWMVSGDKSLATRAVEASGFGKLRPFVPKG